jgi:hypothetical protein
VLAEIHSYAKDMVADYQKRMPSLRVDDPILFSMYLVSQSQYDLISDYSRPWDSLFKERIAACEEYEKKGMAIAGPRVWRNFGLHDALAEVTWDGKDVAMTFRGGLGGPSKATFLDASVVEGTLPDRFGGLYTEIGFSDGRYEIGFLADTDEGLSEFTLTADDVLMEDSHGKTMGSDRDPSLSFARNWIRDEWQPDPERKTYARRNGKRERIELRQPSPSRTISFVFLFFRASNRRASQHDRHLAIGLRFLLFDIIQKTLEKID